LYICKYHKYHKNMIYYKNYIIYTCPWFFNIVLTVLKDFNDFLSKIFFSRERRDMKLRDELTDQRVILIWKSLRSLVNYKLCLSNETKTVGRSGRRSAATSHFLEIWNGEAEVAATYSAHLQLHWALHIHRTWIWIQEYGESIFAPTKVASAFKIVRNLKPSESNVLSARTETNRPGINRQSNNPCL